LKSKIKKCFQIVKNDFIKAGEASIQAQSILKSMYIDPKLVRRVAICGYESEMNVVMQGSEGLLCIKVNEQRIALDVTDTGEGIADISLAMQAGYSTATEEFRAMGFGAGMGLPNMKKNADSFKIDSKPGKGTRIQMTFNRNQTGS
jgi:serine/threonine-protein kinase RsbT